MANQPTYGTRTAFGSVANLNSLAAGQAKGVGSVDNSSTRANGFKIDVSITLNSTGVSATGTLTVYLLESADGANYTDGISPSTASDATSSIKNARPIRQYAANANNQVIRDVFDLPMVQAPKAFGLLIANGSGAALAGSGNDVEYTPITYS